MLLPVPAGEVLAEAIADRFGPVMLIVEPKVEMVRLEAQDCPQRRRVGREAPVCAIDVVAAGDRRLDAALARRGRALRDRFGAAPGAVARSAAIGALDPELGLDDGAYRRLHRREVGRAVGCEQRRSLRRPRSVLEWAVEALHVGNARIAAQQSRKLAEQRAHSQIAAPGHAAHAAAERLEPAVRVSGPVRESAESDRLCHERQVLDHHPLLGRYELRHQRLDHLDGHRLLAARVVVEMSAFALHEGLYACRPEAGPLINDHRAGRLVEYLQQAVNIEKGGLVDREKVARSWSVEGPAVDVEVDHRLQRGGRAAILDLHAAAAVELDELAMFREPRQIPDLVGRKVLRSLQEIGRVVVGDDERYRLDRVAARNGAAEDAGQDRAALAGGVAQIAERVSGDATCREGEQRLLLFAERNGRLRASVGERAFRHLHAEAEATGPAVPKRVEKRTYPARIVVLHWRLPCGAHVGALCDNYPPGRFRKPSGSSVR